MQSSQGWSFSDTSGVLSSGVLGSAAAARPLHDSGLEHSGSRCETDALHNKTVACSPQRPSAVPVRSLDPLRLSVPTPRSSGLKGAHTPRSATEPAGSPRDSDPERDPREESAGAVDELFRIRQELDKVTQERDGLAASLLAKEGSRQSVNSSLAATFKSDGAFSFVPRQESSRTPLVPPPRAADALPNFPSPPQSRRQSVSSAYAEPPGGVLPLLSITLDGESADDSLDGSVRFDTGPPGPGRSGCSRPQRDEAHCHRAGSKVLLRADGGARPAGQSAPEPRWSPPKPSPSNRTPPRARLAAQESVLSGRSSSGHSNRRPAPAAGARGSPTSCSGRASVSFRHAGTADAPDSPETPGQAGVPRRGSAARRRSDPHQRQPAEDAPFRPGRRQSDLAGRRKLSAPGSPDRARHTGRRPSGADSPTVAFRVGGRKLSASGSGVQDNPGAAFRASGRRMSACSAECGEMPRVETGYDPQQLRKMSDSLGFCFHNFQIGSHSEEGESSSDGSALSSAQRSPRRQSVGSMGSGPAAEFNVGMIVNHAVHGEGRVVEVTEGAVVVKFPNHIDTRTYRDNALRLGKLVPKDGILRGPGFLAVPGFEFGRRHSDGNRSDLEATIAAGSPLGKSGASLSGSGTGSPTLRSALRNAGDADERRRIQESENANEAAVRMQRMLRGWAARKVAAYRRHASAVCADCGVAKEPGSGCLVCDDAASPKNATLTAKSVKGSAWMQVLASLRAAETSSTRTHPRAWEHVDVFRACIAGDLEKLQEMATSDPSVLRLRDEQGATPLHVCLLRCRLFEKLKDIAQWIIENYPERARDTYHDPKFRGQGALHFPIVHKDIELTRLVLVAAPQTVLSRAVGTFFVPSNMCFFGEWPLLFATSTNQPAVVTMLLDVAQRKLGRSRAEMLAKRDRQGNTVLHMCVHHNLPGMYRFIDELCMLEPRPDFAQVWVTENRAPENNDGLTPLALAAYLGKFDVFQYLMEKQCMDESFHYGAFRDRVVWLDDLDRMEGTCRGALQILIERSHHQLLSQSIPMALLQHKWRQVYGPRFRRRVALSLAYNVVFVLAYLVRKAEDEWMISHACELAVTGVSAVQFCVLIKGLADVRNQHRDSGMDELVNALVHATLVLVAAAIRWGPQRHFGWLYDTDVDKLVLAVAALSLWVRTLYYFLGFESTGPFVIMIWRMVGNDIKRFLLLFGTFMIGFSQAFYLLQTPRTPWMFVRRLFSSFTTLLGEVELHVDGSQEEDVKMLFPFFATLLLTLYALLVTVLLLNLLIAMMSSTYSDIHEESDKLWNLEFARIMYAMERHDHFKGERNKESNRYWIEKNGRRFFCLPMVTANDVNEYWGGEQPDYDIELKFAKKKLAPRPGDVDEDDDEKQAAANKIRQRSRNYSGLPGLDSIGTRGSADYGRPASPASSRMAMARRKSMDYRRNLIDMAGSSR